MIRRISPKILLTLFTALLLGLPAQAQSDKVRGAESFDFWVDHLPYNSFYHIAALDDLTFAATENSLLIVHQGEYERLSRVNGLTGSNITALASDENSQTVWIGYANGRLDIWENGAIQSIVDIVETPSYTGLKQVNDFAFYNGKAYVATDFGVVEFDIATRLAGRTLLLGPNYTPVEILSIDINPDGLALAWSPNHPSQDLLLGNITENNPNWSAPTPAWTITGSIDHICWHDAEQTFIAAYNDLPTGQSLLYRITPQPGNPITATKAAYPGMGNSHPTMMYHNILDLHTTGQTLTVTRNYNVLTRTATAPLTYTDSANISGVLFAEGVFNPTCATHDDATGTTYIGNRRTGLIRSRNLTDNSRILPNAPYSTRGYKIIPYGLGRNNSPVPQTSA